jgi:acyl-coenzyme A thioesterase PaaI-like protein
MDATCGTAVIFVLKEPVPVATLDLRIDYLKPGLPEKAVHARAHCFKVARSVAFVRCEAFHPETPDDLIAVANGTFMIFRDKGRRRRSQK